MLPAVHWRRDAVEEMTMTEVLDELRAELSKAGVAESDMEDAIGAARLAVWMRLSSTMEDTVQIALEMLARRRSDG